MSVGAGSARGQASVEVVALLPLLLVVGAAMFAVLAAGAGRELAHHAAEAGAVALAEGADARAAARAAVPGWSRRGLSVDVRGTRVEVRLRPPAPVLGLGDVLTTRSVADAGSVR
jgi:Flp pilus assembly protein TadG